MNLTKHHLHTAAFMASGLTMADYEQPKIELRELLDHYDGGHTELIAELIEHAPYAEALVEAGYKVTGSFPGVPAYDIHEAFGSWFAHEVMRLEPQSVPPADACQEELRRLTIDFFADGGDLLPEQREEVVAAVQAVPTGATVTVRLTLDVTYEPNGITPMALRQWMYDRVEAAIGRGLTGDSKANVVTWDLTTEVLP